MYYGDFGDPLVPKECAHGKQDRILVGVSDGAFDAYL